MGKIDKPWGYEEQVLATQIDIGDKTGMLGVRRLVINADEMTSYSYHEKQQDILYLEEGNAVLRKDDEMISLENADAKIVRSGEKHQIQNINDEVVVVLEISFPYKPEDIIRVEDPYNGQR